MKVVVQSKTEAMQQCRVADEEHPGKFLIRVRPIATVIFRTEDLKTVSLYCPVDAVDVKLGGVYELSVTPVPENGGAESKTP